MHSARLSPESSDVPTYGCLEPVGFPRNDAPGYGKQLIVKKLQAEEDGCGAPTDDARKRGRNGASRHGATATGMSLAALHGDKRNPEC